MWTDYMFLFYVMRLTSYTYTKLKNSCRLRQISRRPHLNCLNLDKGCMLEDDIHPLSRFGRYSSQSHAKDHSLDQHLFLYWSPGVKMGSKISQNCFTWNWCLKAQNFEFKIFIRKKFYESKWSITVHFPEAKLTSKSKHFRNKIFHTRKLIVLLFAEF